MNYQEIFKISLLLISSPAKAWEEIRLQEDKQKVFVTFVYPMIGLCALSFFIGTLLTHGWGGPESFQIAMQKCCVVAVALFAGLYLAAFLINKVGVALFQLPNDNLLAQQFAGYALVVTYLTYIVAGIFPSFSIVGLFLQFYVFYIVWKASVILMEVSENKRVLYSIIASVLLILCPWIIQYILNELLFLLN